jgi:hypothetical protein
MLAAAMLAAAMLAAAAGSGWLRARGGGRSGS